MLVGKCWIHMSNQLRSFITTISLFLFHQFLRIGCFVFSIFFAILRWWCGWTIPCTDLFIISSLWIIYIQYKFYFISFDHYLTVTVYIHHITFILFCVVLSFCGLCCYLRFTCFFYYFFYFWILSQMIRTI